MYAIRSYYAPTPKNRRFRRQKSLKNDKVFFVHYALNSENLDFEAVITSYSIHYTKLYEICVDNRRISYDKEVCQKEIQTVKKFENGTDFFFFFFFFQVFFFKIPVSAVERTEWYDSCSVRNNFV